MKQRQSHEKCNSWGVASPLGSNAPRDAVPRGLLLRMCAQLILHFCVRDRLGYSITPSPVTALHIYVRVEAQLRPTIQFQSYL